MSIDGLLLKTLKTLRPFLKIDFNCLKAAEQLQGDRNNEERLLTTESPGVPGSHLINLGRSKC